jgi:uncharacterized protein YggE
LKQTIIALGLITSCALSAQAQFIFAPDTTRRVSVTGTGSVEVQPDIGSVSLGVLISDADLGAAKRAADQAVQRLLSIAERLGIAPSDLSSTILDISPWYSESEVREFLGYEVSRGVTVTLRDLSKLDELIDSAIAAGANREFFVVLKSSRERELRSEAVELAIADAKAQAEQLAKGFGAILGPVRSIGPGDRRTSSATAAALSYGSGSFRPGTIRIEAEVSVTYTLEP